MTSKSSKDLTSDEFAGLDAQRKVEVLEDLFSAGLRTVQSQNFREAWQEALYLFQKVVNQGGKAQVFADLSTKGKTIVLKALAYARYGETELENSEGGWQRAIEYCRHAGNLGGQTQAFADLDAEGKAYVLWALFMAGFSESKLTDNSEDRWRRELRWYLQAIELGGQAPVFAGLSREGKAPVLRALVHAGGTFLALEDNAAGQQTLLGWCRQAIDLGGQKHVFADLDVYGKEAVLRALVRAGSAEVELERNANGWKRALNWYRMAIDLGGQAKVFAGLSAPSQAPFGDASGKPPLLSALVAAGDAVVKVESNHNSLGRQQALDWFRQAVNLSGQAEGYSDLNPEEMCNLLQAMCNAGIVEGSLKENAANRERALSWYQQVVDLGATPQVFADLCVHGKWAVLTALYQIAVIEILPPDNTEFWKVVNTDGWMRALDNYSLAVALGESEFDLLTPAGKGSFLTALLNKGDIEGKHTNKGAQALLEESMRVIELGLPCFNHLDDLGKSSVLSAMRNAGVAQSNLESNLSGFFARLIWAIKSNKLLQEECMEMKSLYFEYSVAMGYLGEAFRLSGLPRAGWISLWGLVCEYNSWGHIDTEFDSTSGLLDPNESINGVDYWLLKVPPVFANPKFSDHLFTIGSAARARLAQIAVLKRHDLLGELCLHESWPLDFRSLEHWILAHLAIFAPDLLPPKQFSLYEDQKLWMPDAFGMAQALQFHCLWNGSSLREPSYLAKLLPSKQINSDRYQESSIHSIVLAEWLNELFSGNPQPMAQALKTAWLGLMDDQLTGVGRLCRWLMRQGIEEADAWQRAREAVLTARCDGLLKEVLNQRWDQPGETRAPYRSLENARLTETAAATHGHTPLQASIQHNLRFFANASLNQALGVDAAHDSADVDRLWELLQLQRLGVALAITPKRPAGWSSIQGLTWDSLAESSIQAMQKQLLFRARAHEEARQRGEHLPKADERNEPLEPFATYAREWRRMGWDLVLPTPQQTAGCLREGQALVQFHLSEDGSVLHALVLRPGTGSQSELSLLELGSGGIDVQAVTRAARKWQQALAEQDAVSTYYEQNYEQSDAIYIIALSEPMRAMQYQWQSWQQPSHPLHAVMHWLHEQAPKGVVCVWPHAWSSLPWQALWALAFEQAEPLRCVASVGAWVRAQTRTALESDVTGEPLGPVVLCSRDIWDDGGEAEVKAIARTLEVEPKESNDLGEVLEALKAKGPVHLAMHGQFDALDPWRSALVVEQMEGGGQNARGVRLHVRKVRKTSPQQDQAVQAQDDAAVFEKAYLPAWALSQVAIQADITLGVCESLQEGQGEGQAVQLGAAGFGAMLMAAGARSVTGSLWACDAWSAALFYDFWYEERRHHPAALALQRTQKRLRELREDSFLDRVVSAAPNAEKRAKDRCQLARDLGWARPFDHPACWAAFALLGDAPTLQLKSTHAPKTSMVKAIMAWMASWWRRRPPVPGD